MKELVLDSQIRDWVFLPILIIKLLTEVILHNIMKLSQSDKKPDRKSIIQNQILARSNRLKANSNFIPYSSFATRRAFFNNPDTGLLTQEKAPENPLLNGPMSDPTALLEGSKRSMFMVLPQIVFGGFCNYFFDGFVVAKLPFYLTHKFKPMIQKSMETIPLDTSYVTSLSWYFLVLFGIRGLTSLVLGEKNLADEAQMMMGGQMNPAEMSPQQPVLEIHKVFLSEKENLELVKHEWGLENAVQNLLASDKY
eukprot:TRINITY_DN4816_c0_g1_i1.p1 TRINITY_DN4816_c0_g1~~TRINITY_DN4816_c0_g1_i1.p1  ORF type:complete len:281 (-),score=73.62 TRINITY_DN4816_c0_g1_i1:145-900(-)